MRIEEGTFTERCMGCLQAFWGKEYLTIKQGHQCLYQVVAPYIHKCFDNLLADQRHDAIQNTLLKIHTAERNTVITSCKSWVLTIAHREGISLLRKEQRHMEERQPLNDDGDMNHYAEKQEDFDQLLHWQKSIERLIVFLENDSGGKDDLAIITALANGESHEEIAAKLNRSRGAIATRVSMLRKKLHALRDDCFE